MFGLFHIDVYRLLPTALLGVMLSFITWRSGSLLPAIAAHFLNNAVLVLLGHLGLDRRVDSVGTGGKAGHAGRGDRRAAGGDRRAASR